MVMKPILMIREEFISDLVKLINESDLPLIMIEPILKDMLSDVTHKLRTQYVEEVRKYQEDMMKESEENGKTEDHTVPTEKE